MTDSFSNLLTAYALTPPLVPFELTGGINNSIIGLHTGDGDFVLKTLTVHNDLAMLGYEHELLAWLATQPLSFAVPSPIPTTHGDTLLATPAGYQLLLPYVSGQLPDPTNMDHVEAIGSALAELHIALARYPTHARPGMAPFGVLEGIHPQLPDPYTFTPTQLNLPETVEYTVRFAWWRAELADLRTFIASDFTRLPRQVIHGDYGPSNTLYEHGRINAVLDFEFAGPDARAMDVANGLIFTMRLWANPTPLIAVAAFCRGYGRQQRLTSAEIAAIPWLMRLFNATASVWWLGRDLKDGQHEKGLEHVADMQQLATWLQQHQEELLETLNTALHSVQ